MLNFYNSHEKTKLNFITTYYLESLNQRIFVALKIFGNKRNLKDLKFVKELIIMF